MKKIINGLFFLKEKGIEKEITLNLKFLRYFFGIFMPVLGITFSLLLFFEVIKPEMSFFPVTYPATLLLITMIICFVIFFPTNFKIIKKGTKIIFIKKGPFFIKSEKFFDSKNAKIIATKTRFSATNFQINAGANCYYIKLQYTDKNNQIRELDFYPKILYFTTRHHLFSEKEINELTKLLDVKAKFN
jgi:hypothetical protein|tara:strand:+ start:107 stop:670 length:564 start_codon:yes stop_codon:yes gene_type:complete